MDEKYSEKPGLTDLEQQHGLVRVNTIMGWGETRFRLGADDGSSYIRTIATNHDTWQNSHFHKTVRETYIMQKGWCILVEVTEDQERLRFTKIAPPDPITTRPYVLHNIFIPADAIIHCVKHGPDGTVGDWHEVHGLDLLLDLLEPSELHEIKDGHEIEIASIQKRTND